MDNIGKYRVFVHVADTGSLTGAAEELGYSQSAVSHIISGLETDMGVVLFQRSRNGVTLTASGERLFMDAKMIVKAEDAILQKAALLSGVSYGRIRVGSFSSTSILWMPQILKQMKKDHPNIEVYQTHSTYCGVEDLLKNGRIDCGFLSSTHSIKCDFIPLKEDEMMIVLPRGHELAAYERVPLEALNDEDYILLNEGSNNYDIARILSGVNVNIIHTVEDDFVSVPLVEEGLGFTILPKMVLNCIETRAVVKSFAVPRFRTIGLAVPSLKDASPLTKLFIDIVQNYLESIEDNRNDPRVKIRLSGKM